MASRLGRPRGWRINPDAYQALAAGTTQAAVAAVAGKTAGYLSSLLSGDKGAQPDVAEAITEAIRQLTKRDDLKVGALFPEAAQFKTSITYFTAPPNDEVAA